MVFETVKDILETPSLLRQIVDEADSLDEISKEEVLRNIRLQKALVLA